MAECSACGTRLAPHELRCPNCGKVTAQYHRQRRCMHCGTPVANQAKTCLMCHKPVDRLPLNQSIFSGSWLGIGLGVAIIVILVISFNRYQQIFAIDTAAVVVDTATPTPSPTPTMTATTTPLPPTSTPTFTPLPTATPRLHAVEPGQTLLFIAQSYGVPLNVLLDTNNLTGDEILSIGQEIKIPPALEDTGRLDSRNLPPQIIYIVKSGDTLSDIAWEHSTTVENITLANPNLDLTFIFPGQELTVPLSTPTPTATSTVPPTPTATPGPEYPAPQLLSPADEEVLDQDTVLLNWASPRLLESQEYYVVELDWPGITRTKHWIRNTSLRLTKNERPTNGRVVWTVSIVRRTDTSSQGDPVGTTLSPRGESRIFEWR